MDSLTWRRAGTGDARLLFDWRNDPRTRRASHNGDELDFGSHLAWLEAALASPDREIMVFEEEERPVGTVRVDREADGVAELSWTVAPEARGRGIAGRMVRAAADRLSREHVLRAEVKEGSVASARVAEGAGFSPAGRAGGVLHYRRERQA